MAALYDGQTGVRRDVEVTAADGMLLLSDASGGCKAIPAGELRLVDRQTGGITLMRPGHDGWRLRVPPPVDPAVDGLFPRRHGYGRWIDRIGPGRALLVFAALSAGVVALGFYAPVLLAPLIPESVERAYGNAMVGDFGGHFCRSAKGEQALARLVARLDPGAGDLRVRVVDLPVANAAALPARQIVIFAPLIRDAAGPDELAGVLAHEIAHVRRRHVTQAMVRQLGLGMFAATLGGSVGGNLDGLAQLSFTRAAEREADDDAMAMLARAQISPLATARFFDRVAGEDATTSLPGMTYLSTHPDPAGRAARFRRAGAGAPASPALSARDWQALRRICDGPPTG
ncbi:M48 family metalloprotease [Sphingomonas changnyeongensis]|uniref:M48 family metalloprotease n=1 Tax=Sphingomonas changnyeongensis TaxID=2698679 RepID=A0A7Z2S7N7_9SPHN|nr:M48 family metallopeptidase [Sphingomonas changnyeongensis]QHL89817.1 M48 family metalloprotease [Sphingomonas changnyeongensis]